MENTRVVLCNVSFLVKKMQEKGISVDSITDEEYLSMSSGFWSIDDDIAEQFNHVAAVYGGKIKAVFNVRCWSIEGSSSCRPICSFNQALTKQYYNKEVGFFRTLKYKSLTEL